MPDEIENPDDDAEQDSPDIDSTSISMIEDDEGAMDIVR